MKQEIILKLEITDKKKLTKLLELISEFMQDKKEVELKEVKE